MSRAFSDTSRFRVMNRNGICVCQKQCYRVTTDSTHKRPVAPDQLFGSEITYVWTANGWRYLAAVRDLFSGDVVG